GAQALYQIGAAVDDLQYGFRGVLNNIPQIAIALGNPAMAGGLAIAATVAYQLYTHLDKIKELLGLASSHAITLGSQIDEIKGKAANAANEMERMAFEGIEKRMKAVQKAAEDIEEAPEAQEKANKEAKKALAGRTLQEQQAIHAGIANTFDVENSDLVRAAKKQKA